MNFGLGDVLSLCELSLYVYDVLVRTPKPWLMLFDDLVAKGSSSITMAPELAELTTKLEETEPTKLTPEMLNLLATRIPVLKKSMRSGSTSGVEKLLYKRVVALAQEVGKVDGMSVSLLDALQSGLSLFRETTGVLQLLSKLDVFRKEQLPALCSVEIRQQLVVYPEDPASDVPADSLWPSLQRLVHALRMVEELDAGLFPGLKLAVWWHFRVLHSVAKAHGKNIVL